jgi:phospholipase C
MPTRALGLTFISTLLLILAACGGNSSNGPNSAVQVTAVPHFSHVAIVVLENASYPDVINNPAMPYMNTLASQYASLASYHANFKPSIPNYFMLSAGNPETFDDSFSSTVSDDNLVREFIASGVSWKAYDESIPAAGYTGGDSGLYIERHDPLSYFSDVRNDPAQAANIVPLAQLATDMSSGSLPNFLWITPNALDSAHDCPSSNTDCSLSSRLTTADTWLKANVQPLLASPAFANGLLIVVFDEGEDVDVDHIGGHVACVFAGAHVKAH